MCVVHFLYPNADEQVKWVMQYGGKMKGKK